MKKKTPPKKTKKEVTPKNRGGRPPKKNKAIEEKLCVLIGLGYTNRQAAEACGIDKSQMYRWIEADAEFRDQYAKACQDRCEHWADEVLEISDDGLNDWVEREKAAGEMHLVFNGEHFQRSRLRVDTRKWLLSKLQPKKYGEKIQQEISGKDGGPIQAVICFGNPDEGK